MTMTSAFDPIDDAKASSSARLRGMIPGWSRGPCIHPQSGAQRAGTGVQEEEQGRMGERGCSTGRKTRLHGERLARAGLAVCKNRSVETLEEPADDWANVGIHILLHAVRAWCVGRFSSHMFQKASCLRGAVLHHRHK